MSMQFKGRYLQDNESATDRRAAAKKNAVVEIMKRMRPTNVMVDVSLLVQPDKLNHVLKVADDSHGDIRLCVSGAAADNLTSREPSADLLAFFDARRVGLPSVSAAIKGAGQKLQRFTPTDKDLSGLDKDFGSAIAEAVQNRTVSDVLVAEWLFLNNYSVVAASADNAFRKFVDAGAAAIEFGKSTVDRMTRKTLKLKARKALEPVDRLRAAAKWIAVGGPIVSKLLPTPAAIGVGLVSAYFFLFDPDPESPVTFK